MGAYSEYYLNSRRTIVQLDLIEMTHPNFTRAYRIVRNARKGIVVDLGPGELGVPFEYYPARVESMGARDDLDAAIRVDLGDLGELIPNEVDAVMEAGGNMIKPAMRYWTYRSDQLDAPMYGPLHLEIPSINMTEEGSSFEAKAPSLNSSKTGERLTLDRIPMQRGFL